MTSRFIKRAFDLTVSFVGLLVASPLIVLLAVLVRWDLGRPVFFTQERPGLHGEPFRLVKFRTMNNRADAHGNVLPDEARLTKVGALLRKWSLDEIPELWNVLVGDMSLVGPRPLLMEYLPLYSERQARRHDIRPGLTGLAQVSGRNGLSWEEKFDLDVYYVEHWSLAMDFGILFRTVLQVLSAKDVSAKGHATMPPFTGTRKRVQGL